MRDQERIKVLHLISSSGLLGAENVLLELALQSRLAGLDVTIGVFENSRDPNFELANSARERGFAVRIFPCRGRFDNRTVRMIRDYLLEKEINILHSHNYKSNFYAWKALPDDGCRWVVTNHGRRIGFVLLLYNLIDSFIVRSADRVVTVSDKIADEMIRLGVAADKIVVICNGIDIERFVPGKRRKELRQSFGFDEGLPVVGTVGSLTTEKGHRFLVDAAKTVVSQCPEVRFLIVGDGPQRQVLEEMVKRANLAEKVFFTGKREDIPDVLAMLDLFVLPSLKEGLPMALLEALAVGLPVVATKVGAIPKVIDDRRTGLLVEPGNTKSLAMGIMELIKDIDSAKLLGRKGLQKVSDQFSASVMNSRYLVVYNQLLDKC